MVREVQMSWDSECPIPDELERQDWDLDDPVLSDFDHVTRSKSKGRDQRVASKSNKKKGPNSKL